MNFPDELKALYMQQSKHSNYQVLPRKLRPYLDEKNIVIKSRHEEARLNYIANELELCDKSLLDIGGNSGFFSLELLEIGVKDVVFYEGNKTHAEFVKTATKMLGLSDRLIVNNSYLDIETFLPQKKIDITLLMNILHHFGDDYGDPETSIDEAKLEIMRNLQKMAEFTRYLVFQLGYNWKGNVQLPLFEGGTKKEQINFIRSIASAYWDFVSIGIAEQLNDRYEYKKISKNNIDRQDEFGEFLNRPLFIMKSKLC